MSALLSESESERDSESASDSESEIGLGDRASDRTDRSSHEDRPNSEDPCHGPEFRQ
jgi:hypothetical protein